MQINLSGTYMYIKAGLCLCFCHDMHNADLFIRRFVFFLFVKLIVYVLMLIVERTGAVVNPRTLGQEVPGLSPPVAVRCGLEQVTYPQLLR